MDIGSAIKNIRTRKKITQKDLASKCNISANALCSIEKNSSFPSKETIKKICDALEIPVSYLLFFSITKEDVPEEKLSIFNALREPIQKILVDND
jgi:transcriptional regulator with XRE-family HTH domain